MKFLILLFLILIPQWVLSQDPWSVIKGPFDWVLEIISGTRELVVGLLLAPVKAALAIVVLIIGVPVLLSSLFYTFMVYLAAGLAHLTVTLPITSGWAYEIGWQLTRDLANMLFIIILVIIALSTILRIEEYRFQKTLPKLLIIALLVNFSPVIVGVIVDLFNLFTKFFIEKTDLGLFVNLMSPLGTYVWDQVKALVNFTETLDIQFGRLFGLTVSGFYFFLASLVFLGVFFLFLGRTLFFWILFILAPLAFAAYILPGTRGWWRGWWRQLFRWGLIGFFLAFFLYLATHLLANASALFQVEEMMAGLTEISQIAPAFPEALRAIFPGLVAILFIALAIFLSLLGGKRGVERMSFWIETSRERVSKFIKSQGLATLKATVKAARIIPGIPQAEEALRRRLEARPVLRPVPPLIWERERLKRMEEARKSMEGLSDKEILTKISRRPITEEQRYQRAAAIEILAQRKSLPSEAGQYFLEAQRLGMDLSTVYKARPDLAPYLINPQTNAPMTIREVVAKISPVEFREKVQLEALKSPEVFLSLNVEQLKEIENRGSPEQKTTIRETIINKEKEIIETLRNLEREGKREEYERGLKVFIMAKQSPILGGTKPSPILGGTKPSSILGGTKPSPILGGTKPSPILGGTKPSPILGGAKLEKEGRRKIKRRLEEPLYPEDSSGIIDRLLEKHGLKEEPEEFLKKKEKGETTIGEILVSVIQGAVEGEIAIEDLAEILAERLNLLRVKAEDLAEDIEKEILSLTKGGLTKEKKEIPGTEKPPEEKPKKEDIYREPIE